MASKTREKDSNLYWWGAVALAICVLLAFADPLFERGIKFAGYAVVESEGISNISVLENRGMPLYNVNLIKLRQPEPLVIGGWLVAEAKDRTNQLEVGDMVAYRSTSYHLYVTHRIVSIDFSTGMFSAQGDNRTSNPVPDPPEKIENIIGEVVTLRLGPIEVPFYMNVAVMILLSIGLTIALFATLAHDYGEERFRDRRGDKSPVGEILLIVVIAIVIGIILYMLGRLVL